MLSLVHVLNENVLKQQFNELIKTRNQTNRDNLLFLQRIWLKLTKNRQKIIQKYWFLLYWVYHN